MLKISIINLPGAYLSVIYGIKDILEYANDNFHSTFEIKISSPDEIIQSRKRPDYIIIPPFRFGRKINQPQIDNRLAHALKKFAGQGAIPVSVCAGAFYLCASGIADQKQVTTHWALADALSKTFPMIEVKKDKILIDNGQFISAAGMTSYQDLTLFLINRHIGRAEALAVARIFLINPESRSQLQYIVHNLDVAGTDSVLNKARSFIHNHFAGPIGLPDIASHCSVTVRTLLRHFKTAGYTPSSYLQTIRIDHAKLLFETSNDALKEVAQQCGYEDPAAFSRVFLKITGLRPGAYQKKWRSALS
jgi:transcriptional regulator GlxA family with amidase domain